MAALENKSEQYLKPTPESEKAALASAQLPPDLRAWIPDPAAPTAYPIVTYTWILAYKKYADPRIKDALKERHAVRSDRRAEIQRRARVHSAA
jgi:phosphate transport system substrate-binding protein